MIKKLFAIMCTFALILVFTACGQTTDPAATEATEGTEMTTDYTQQGEQALASAQELADSLDQSDISAMLEANTEHCDQAKRLEKAIGAYMKEHPDITYAYRIRSTDDSNEKAEFLINWEDTDEYWGEEFEMYDEPISALNGTAVYDKEPTTDEDGTVITGYAPVRIDDKVAVVVCVDYAVK